MSQKNRTKYLCRFENDLAPIQLEESKDTVSISIQQLEQGLEDCLDEQLEDRPAVEYKQQADAAWLKCRRPPQPPEETEPSLTGLMEQFQLPPDVAVSLTCWTVEQPCRVSRSIPNMASSPHSEWERVSLAKLSSDPVFQEPLRMEWVDLRELYEPHWLSTLASTVHFFRSLLDCRHTSSPWTNETKESHEPDCVLLVLSELPERYEEVRVSDACPSWYLHSICQLKLPRERRPWDTDTSNLAAEQATLLIYRRLAPRDRLSLRHPWTGQPAHTGCLWEMYSFQPEPTEENPSPEPMAQCRMVAPPYINWRNEYPCLMEPLLKKEALAIIRQEALSISHWTAWPESQHYRVTAANKSDDGGAPWNVFPLCYCFPADCVANRQWLQQTCRLVPKTVALLQEHLGDTLRTALFSRLDPEAVLEAHTGWQDLANHVMRLHIPLTVPPGGLCGTWVDGCVETHQVGRPLCFDDSKIHRAFNYSRHERIVLILDLARPKSLPLGTAVGGHTDELNQFIEQMNGSSS